MDHTTTAVEQDEAGAPADEDMDLDDDFDEADIEMNEDGRFRHLESIFTATR